MNENIMCDDSQDSDDVDAEDKDDIILGVVN